MQLLIVVFLAGIAFFTAVMIYDVNRYVIRNYKFKTGKLKKPYRFVVLSDLHNKQFGKDNKRLLDEIERQKPEAVFLAGDMITAKVGVDMQPTLRFLKKLSEKYPVFYGQGNHEYRIELYPEVFAPMLAEFQEGMKECRITPMKNTHTELGEYGITVFGVEIEREFYKRFKHGEMSRDYLKGLLGEPRPEQYNILIAHNPDYFPEYAEWGADLVLSGHVHGGLMRLPLLGGVVSPAVRLFPEYDGGVFAEKESRMILSRGLGTHTLPIRIFNPGELIVVELEP